MTPRFRASQLGNQSDLRANVFLASLILCLMCASTGRAQNYLWNRADFATASNPVSVVVGDFNADGIPDLAVVDQGTSNYGFLPPGSVSVLLGKPDETFGPKADFEVGVTPSSIAVGDFNGDGKLDLAVTNSGGDTVSILIGGGDGTFDSEVQYPAGTSPSGIIVSDFDGDGHVDLAVLGRTPCCYNPPLPGTLTILLGKGDGTFKATQKSIGDSPSSIVSGDFNGDGKVDLAVSNTSDNTVSVFLGNGDGTFNRIDSSASLSPVAIAAADFNGDGRLDLVAASSYGSNANLLLGMGDGTFQLPVPIPSTSAVNLVIAADVNGDGNADLLSTVNLQGASAVGVLLGNGDGTFQPQLISLTSGTNFGFALDDLNGDGRMDLALPNPGQNSVSVMLGNGDGTFTTKVDFALSTNAQNAIAVADFNKDGLPDITVVDSAGFSLLLNNGGRNFDSAQHFASSSTVPPNLIAAADFNGDGAPDVAVGGVTCCSPSSLTLSVLFGNGDGTFQSHVDTTIGLATGPFVTGDFNQDGMADLAAMAADTSVYPYTYSILLLQGNGDGTFQAPTSITLGKGCCGYADVILTGNLNKDGTPDLLVYASGLNNTFILLGNGNGTFQTPASLQTGGGSMATGDFNGDGKLDVALVNGCNQVSIFPGNGNGTFQSSIPSTLPGPCIGQSELVAGDFNGDSKLDMAATGTGGVVVLTGKGDGTFHGLVSFADSPYEPFPLATADFNQDGVSDLASETPNSFISAVSIVSVFYSQPEVAIAPSQPGFGSQMVSTTSAAQSITVTNIGNAQLTVTGAETSGDFAATNDCTVPLAPGGSCSVSVTFTPTAAGVRNGILTIADNVPGSPQAIALSGAGVGPLATLSSTSFDFFWQVVGSRSFADTVTLTNAGDAPLNVEGIALGGANSADYAQTNTCGASVAAGANCTISVTFKPTAAGARSGTLTITDNAPGSPQTVALSGTGVDFAIAPAPGSSTTSSVTAGQTATFNLAFSGEGGLSGTGTLSCSGAPALATCTITPNSLTLSGTTPANTTVSITTTARGMVAPQNELQPPTGKYPGLPVTSWWLALILTAGLMGAAWRYRELIRTRCPAPVRMGLASAVLFAAILATLSMPGCGGGSTSSTQKPGTPAGTYTIDVKGVFTFAGTYPNSHTSFQLTTTHDIKLTLTVN